MSAVTIPTIRRAYLNVVSPSIPVKILQEATKESPFVFVIFENGRLGAVLPMFLSNTPD